MIIPDKNRTLRNSMLWISSLIINELNTPQTLSSLWEKIRTYKEVNTFEKFVLAMDMLYILELIEFEEGIIKKNYD